MQKDLVRNSYNVIAAGYRDYRDGLAGVKYVHWLLQHLPKRASILDIGCGSGTVVDEALIKAGHLVTGIDISEKQVALARRDYPRGNFVVRDMLTLKRNEYQVDAVVSFYALFHAPRGKHLAMLSTFASYLPVGGKLLVTMGDRDFEGKHEMMGVPMWSSHFGPEKNRKLIAEAGFVIEKEEMDRSGNERHQIVLARKR